MKTWGTRRPAAELAQSTGERPAPQRGQGGRKEQVREGPESRHRQACEAWPHPHLLLEASLGSAAATKPLLPRAPQKFTQHGFLCIS